MKIDKDQIAHKEVLGHTEDQEPITYVETTGGLHVIFKKNKNGKIESIAASPHKSISMWMAEKKHKIVWKDLSKSQKDSPSLLRLFYSAPILTKSAKEDGYILLNTETLSLDYMSGSDIETLALSETHSKLCKMIIRKADYSDSPQTLWHFFNPSTYDSDNIYVEE
jgi:hypothetical protein